MKSRIAGIILIISLISPVITTHVWMNYKKLIVRKEVKKQIISGLGKDKMVLYKFTRKESREKLRWEHPGEFEYNDRMYDVVDTDTIQDTIYYRCFCDDEESRLNRQFSVLVRKILHTNPQNRDKQNQLISYFKSLYFSESYDWHTSLQSTEKKQFIVNSARLFSFSSPPPTPPPRVS